MKRALRMQTGIGDFVIIGVGESCGESMADVDIPNFGELLADHLAKVPGDALPALLAALERTAADRYRAWAEALPAHREGLLECAAREDEIADRAEALFPPSAAAAASIAAVIPAAKATYYAVFEPYTPVEQITIQANAERQGALAWQNFKAAFPEHQDALEALTATELRSADYLDNLLRELATA